MEAPKIFIQTKDSMNFTTRLITVVNGTWLFFDLENKQNVRVTGDRISWASVRNIDPSIEGEKKN